MLGKLRDNEEIELFGDEYVGNTEYQEEQYGQQYSEQFDNQQEVYQDNSIEYQDNISDYQERDYVDNSEQFEETFIEEPNENKVVKNNNTFDEDEEIELF